MYLLPCRLVLGQVVYLYIVIYTLFWKMEIVRGWKGDGKCCLCGVLETINHLLFECVFAKWFWVVIQEVFYERDIPKSLQELSEGWLWGKGPLPKQNIMFFFAGFA